MHYVDKSMNILYSERDKNRTMVGPPSWSPDGKQIVLAFQDRGVSRYREREGERFGSTGAASVAFSAIIYTAPVAHRFWNRKFDETQRPLSEHIVNARRYPGGGTRWLTAAELAQWGAQSMIEAIPVAP